MGIFIDDEITTSNGSKVSDTYGSFSEGVSISKIDVYKSVECSLEDMSNNGGWSVTKFVLDESGNRIVKDISEVEVVHKDGLTTKKINNTVYETVTTHYKHEKSFKYILGGRFIVYVNKEIRSNNNRRINFEDQQARSNFKRQQHFRSILERTIEVESDDCNNVYEKLYSKLKEELNFKNTRDDL